VTRDRGRRLAGAFALMIGLPACGGGSTGPNPPPTPTPAPAPTTSVVFQTTLSLGAEDGGFGDFSIPNNGLVRVTVDWTFPTNDLVYFVFSGTTCNDFVAFFENGAAPGCTLLAQHVALGVKPAVVTFSVTAGQNARILIVNLGERAESGVVQVTLTR
jgi:hypothetical protein